MLAVAMLCGCDSPRGFARMASLDACALLDPAQVTALVGLPIRMEREPAAAGSDMAGSCRIVDDKGEALLAVGVWTDASLNAAGIRSHASGVFDRRLEVELGERIADGNAVERRDLEPEHGKATLLVATRPSGLAAGLFLGVDRGVLVSVVHVRHPPGAIGDFGLSIMTRLREGPGPAPTQ